MSKIILLNGPRECGKNIAVDHLKRYFPLVDRRCKDHLFVLTQKLFNISAAQFDRIYEDRSLKEVPLPEFTISIGAAINLERLLDKQLIVGKPSSKVQLSIRDAMIYVSEILCKPTFGNDYFGKARAATITDNELAIDDSCGFDDEIPPVIEKLGENNVLLIRIQGRGHFGGDSREYIKDGTVKQTIDVYNVGDEKDYLDQMVSISKEFYGRKPFTVERSVAIKPKQTREELAQAIQDELDEWQDNTGVQPVADDVRVIVRFRNGEVNSFNKANLWDWKFKDYDYDIIKWRLYEDAAWGDDQ